MKKTWLLVGAGVMLMLSACAYMENTHLQSAESLPAGKTKLQYMASTSYSFVPALPLVPDSLEIDYPTHRSYAMAIAYPYRMAIGLGSGLELGGQFFFYLGAEKKHPGFEEPMSFGTGASSGKAYLKFSIPTFDNRRISVSPAAILNKGTIETSRRVRYTYDIKGWEVPLTFSFLGSDKDEGHGNSFTFRYSKLIVNGSIWAEGSEPWSQDFYPNQPKQTIERYAVIYTYHFNRGKHRKYFDVGCEFTYVHHDLMFTPIFGMSWEFTSKK